MLHLDHRGFKWAILPAYAARFGMSHFGRVFGLAAGLTGVMSVLQYSLSYISLHPTATMHKFTLINTGICGLVMVSESAGCQLLARVSSSPFANTSRSPVVFPCTCGGSDW